MPSILIAGMGRLGSRLATQLLDRQWQVYGLRRGNEFPDGVQGISCDLLANGELELPSVDYLVYCAAPARGQPDGYRQTYLQAMQQLLKTIDITGLKRAIFTSSTAVYGEDSGNWVDETTPLKPLASNGQIMCQAEQQWLNALADKATVVRMAGLYGTSRFLIDQVVAGKPFNGNSWTNRIHLDDAAGICRFLLEQSEQGTAIETIYNGVDPAVVLSGEVRGWIAEQLNLPLNNQPAEMANKRVSSKKIQQAGYQFIYPDYKAGMKDLITGLQS